MPFEIVRHDITRMTVDAIVNTANPRPVIGRGVDSRIHEMAGPELLAARQQIGNIAPGCAAVTPGYGLQAKFVIHVVGTQWRGGMFGESMLLRSCYDSALTLALENGCQSIAFPLISTGTYGFPKDKALQIAISVFSAFLLKHELQIYLVVFDGDSYRLSEKLFRRVASYIDERYADACLQKSAAPRRRLRRRSEAMCEGAAMDDGISAVPMSLADRLKQADAGFTETLLRLIDRSGKKDSEIYKRANLSKQHFSKIRNNPDYRPTKPTAVALAIALELDLEQTKDLLARAGYALSNSSKFDLIILYFIEQGNYNIIEINMALYEFDQSLLGGRE
ncbi:MAG: macro domain-containing protein [Oscillospiraceae bacterium]|nr:macro domain-containing protein [Oscillospiraceae bacterium]